MGKGVHIDYFLRLRGGDVICEECGEKIKDFPCSTYAKRYPVFGKGKERVLVCCSLHCSKALEKKWKLRMRRRSTDSPK